ncbi:hypothetical protein CC80DRAFT_550435 [Byssothecium circinans]|uniref:Uncharacterized protein n=1 Tax=Byssothecium circinans TaxID=147558 RepID=A0A6A5TP41_9PLEO|nr:hypothetical protein CC80DRAFT_550435 [Byssothecium circinans]
MNFKTIAAIAIGIISIIILLCLAFALILTCIWDELHEFRTIASRTESLASPRGYYADTETGSVASRGGSPASSLRNNGDGGGGGGGGDVLLLLDRSGEV